MTLAGLPELYPGFTRRVNSWSSRSQNSSQHRTFKRQGLLQRWKPARGSDVAWERGSAWNKDAA